MKRTFLLGALTVATVTATFGCRRPARLVLTKDQRARIQENILNQTPKVQVALNANFGDRIELVGVDLEPTRQARPGQTMTVVYYWKCLKETPGDWKVFAHLELPGPRRMLLDHNPVGELYPINQWKKGQIIRDRQRFTLPADVKPGQAVLWVGIYNETIYREQGGGDRMELKNKGKVPNDGQNRVRAVSFRIVKKGATVQQGRPALVTRYAARPPVIDGKLDDEVWKTAVTSKPFVKADGRPASPGKATTVKAAYDDKNLYLAFHVQDPDIETPYRNRDVELWKADVVEVYLDPDSDGKKYVELQVSPAGTVFDAVFEEHRKPDWKTAKAYNLAGLRSAVGIDGTLNKPGDKDHYYEVEMAIPLSSLPAQEQVQARRGLRIRANFFRIDASGGKVVEQQALTPVGGDFHNLEGAGFLVFAGHDRAGANAPRGSVHTKPQSPIPKTGIPIEAIRKAQKALEAQKRPKRNH